MKRDEMGYTGAAQNMFLVPNTDEGRAFMKQARRYATNGYSLRARGRGRHTHNAGFTLHADAYALAVYAMHEGDGMVGWQATRNWREGLYRSIEKEAIIHESSCTYPHTIWGILSAYASRALGRCQVYAKYVWDDVPRRGGVDSRCIAQDE